MYQALINSLNIDEVIKSSQGLCYVELLLD